MISGYFEVLARTADELLTGLKNGSIKIVIDKSQDGRRSEISFVKRPR